MLQVGQPPALLTARIDGVAIALAQWVGFESLAAKCILPAERNRLECCRFTDTVAIDIAITKNPQLLRQITDPDSGAHRAYRVTVRRICVAGREKLSILLWHPDIQDALVAEHRHRFLPKRTLGNQSGTSTQAHGRDYRYAKIASVTIFKGSRQKAQLLWLENFHQPSFSPFPESWSRCSSESPSGINLQ